MISKIVIFEVATFHSPTFNYLLQKDLRGDIGVAGKRCDPVIVVILCYRGNNICLAPGKADGVALAHPSPGVGVIVILS